MARFILLSASLKTRNVSTDFNEQKSNFGRWKSADEFDVIAPHWTDWCRIKCSDMVVHWCREETRTRVTASGTWNRPGLLLLAATLLQGLCIPWMVVQQCQGRLNLNLNQSRPFIQIWLDFFWRVQHVAYWDSGGHVTDWLIRVNNSNKDGRHFCCYLSCGFIYWSMKWQWQPNQRLTPGWNIFRAASAFATIWPTL